MGSRVPAEENAGSASAELASALRYLARQPILDQRGRVHGYELLFRSGPEMAFRGDGNHATRTMIDNTIIFGLERLARGLPGFVNCTADVLTQGQVGVLPPSMTVLEILECIEPTPAIVESCSRLRSMGFRLALDDFSWAPAWQPLINLASYVKVDFLKSSIEERRAIIERLRPFSPALIAEKVETRQDYESACAEGFTLFQGYYFCAPSLVQERTVPANKLFQFELLQVLHDDPLDIAKVSELLKRDASLTYRLLRLVNSPACAVRQEVCSIRSALLAVGDDLFRRIATLAIASELNAGQPSELLRTAFIRARFCELAAACCQLDPAEQYLAGIFSLLPAMLHVSMEGLLPSLPLRQPLREALLGKANRERALLQWIEAEERGEWATCANVSKDNGLNLEDLNACYTKAVVWAEESLPATAE